MTLPLVVAIAISQSTEGCFEVQYVQDKLFAKYLSFGNVSDVVVNEKDKHIHLWVPLTH